MMTLHEKAIDYLSRREHSRRELKYKLLQKNFSASDIDAELDKLAHHQLQSDERFAQSYVRYRKEAGFGLRRIALELQERGVSAAIIATAVNAYSAEDWQQQMINVWQRKFSKPPQTIAEKAKQFRFLSCRGYDSNAIKTLLFLENQIE